MNLHHLLAARLAAGRPVRVGLIGAGKFGSMFLSQVPTTPGLEVAAIVDLSPDRAREACRSVGWDEARIAATNFTDDAAAGIARDDVEVVIEATGNPAAGIRHARLAIATGKHIVMVNVEADALVGPLLAEEARRAGIVYSLAYGDQPALTAELVDWARAAGFRVVAAGKGTKYLPLYHCVTPDEVWSHYGLTPEEAKRAGMNPQMFNSFLDGTKSAIEMVAIANATELDVPEGGLAFPPCGVDDLPHLLRPRSAGGVLDRTGMVEVVSSLERDGRPVFRDLRWGVYVVIEAPNDYAASCFKQYGLKTDGSGYYAAMYKPYHLIGLELGISVLSAALRGEPTGQPRKFRGDVVAVAKRDLKSGEMLDGEGGYTVWGRAMPAQTSLALAALPIGLGHRLPLTRNIRQGEVVRWSDVDLSRADALTAEAIAVRRAMESQHGAPRLKDRPQAAE
jgi:predicted homoserine dehydrogenase-like protein